MKTTVLDGEPAVPCSPQPATVGSNSLPRLFFFRFVPGREALMVRALSEEPPANSVRTGREQR